MLGRGDIGAAAAAACDAAFAAVAVCGAVDANVVGTAVVVVAAAAVGDGIVVDYVDYDGCVDCYYDDAGSDFADFGCVTHADFAEG